MSSKPRIPMTLFAFRRLSPGIVLLALACTATTPSFAGINNDVPSCYAANKMTAKKPQLDREIFVVIDQTTVFDDKLKRSISENLWDNLLPNTAFTVVRFSAFSQGRYTDVVTTGVIEPPLPDAMRDDTSTKLMGKFDSCMQAQLKFARDHAIKAVNASLSDATTDLAKSDILAALKDVSARVKASPAKDKLVFLASDMLENSSVSSFYAAGNRVRKVEASKELALIEKAGLMADFGGSVAVHVIGAGLLAQQGPGAKLNYRDAATMSALNEFWLRYFEKSGARLVQFGAPALLQPVR